jgi:uncharacterized protein (TIGR02271 family)
MFNSRSEADAAASQLRSEIGAEARIIDQSSSSGSSGNGSSGGGFWADLKEMFVADEDRGGYEEGVRRGHFLLTAYVPEDQADRACSLLEQSGSMDLDQSQDQWRSEGWSGQSAYGQSSSGQSSMGQTSMGQTSMGQTSTGEGSSGGSAMFGADNSATGSVESTGQRDNVVQEERIPIIEEQLRVGKREVERGGARVRSYIEERPVHESVNLREEHVHVERRPVDQAISSGALNDDLLREHNVEMRETAEEAVIGKDARVIEEVVVQKTAEQRTQEVEDTVRHTHVDIDEGVSQGSSFDNDRR